MSVKSNPWSAPTSRSVRATTVVLSRSVGRTLLTVVALSAALLVILILS